MESSRGRDRAQRPRMAAGPRERAPATRRGQGIDEHVILMCNEGYQSSLAAATLQQLGFARATDLNGGFQAWRAAGFPIARASEIE